MGHSKYKDIDRCNIQIRCDSIRIDKTIDGKYKIDEFNKLFNIDDYFIIKATKKFKICLNADFLYLKWGMFLLLDKKYNKKENIIKAINILNSFGCFTYVIRPFPPLHILEKIKMI